MSNIRKILCIATACLMFSPVMALAQEIDDDDDEESTEVDWDSIDFSQVEMTQKQAEEYAKLLYGDDIQAGKLTLKQGAEYARCTQKDYAASFLKSPEAKKYSGNLERMSKAKGMTANEKARLNADIKRSLQVLEAFQDQAEERCAKQLGTPLIRRKSFARHAR